MSEVPEAPQRRLRDDEIYNRLHQVGNYLSNAHNRNGAHRESLVDAGLKLLNETLAQVGSFSDLSPQIQSELVTQKINWKQPLTPEETKFGIEKGWILKE